MNVRRTTAAMLAVPVLLGAGALRAAAAPEEVACNDSPDGGYTLCLLWTDSDESSRRNDIVYLAVNDDPETDEDEGGIDAHLYQYEFDGLQSVDTAGLGGFSGYGTGAYLLAHDVFDHDRMAEIDAEHGGRDDYYGGEQFTYANATLWDQAGNTTGFHAFLGNSNVFEQQFGELEIGIDQNDDKGYRFVGIRANAEDCAIFVGGALASCPLHPGVPPNPPPAPFLPIP